MIEALYIGTLLPLFFLIMVIKGEYRRLIVFFTWGLTSTILVYFINIFIDTYIIPDETLLLSQIIPVMEEGIKFLPLLIFMRKNKSTSRYNIVRYAMAVGIGFSILENYLYLTITTSNGISDSLFFIVTRSLTACVLHGSMTALVGYAIQVMMDYEFISLPLLAGMFILSSTIHSIYNLSGLTESLQVLGIIIPVFLFFVQHYLFNIFGRKRVSGGLRRK